MFDRAARLTLLLAGFAAATALSVPVETSPAAAQQAGGTDGAVEAPRQVTLTQKQIDDFVAAQQDLAAVHPPEASKDVQGEEGQNAEQPDPKVQARAESAVKKHGFSGLDAYEGVFDSIGIVFAGIDPTTKTYVGPAAIIKKQIAQVQVDKTVSANDKAQALSDLKEALGAAGAAKPVAGNTDLVIKNYDKLSSAFQGSE